MHLLLDSRHFACRRSSQSPWPISWSHTAAVSFPLWVLWWSASKPSRHSYPRLSIRSKVCPCTHPNTQQKFSDLGFKRIFTSLLRVSLCLSDPRGGGGLCGVQLETKPPLQSHSLSSALPDLHGGMCLHFLCWITYTLFLQWFKNSWTVHEIVTTSDLLLSWVCFSCYSMWDCSCCDFSVCLYSHECFVLLYFGLGVFLLIDERTKLSSGSMTLIETRVLFTVGPSN